MERLTIPDVKIDEKTTKRAFVDGDTVRACAMEFYWRLKKIEDIIGDNYNLDHFRELVEADREGRCVVLPCKEGAILQRDGFNFEADHWNIVLTAFAEDESTKSGHRLKLFHIEEAEAALKGEGNP